MKVCVTRMQWDIPFIHNLDINLFGFLFDTFNDKWIDFIGVIYQFKPIKFLPFVCIFCWLWYKNTDATIRTKVIDAVMYGFISLVFCRILSYTAPFRARPKSTPNFDHLVTNIPSDGWSSFPSDHGVFAFAMTYAIYRIHPVLGIMMAVHSMFIICLPRALLGLHYPSDLLFGALLGILSAYFLSKLKLSATLSNTLFKVYLVKPIVFYTLSAILLFEFVEMFETPRAIVFQLYDWLK